MQKEKVQSITRPGGNPDASVEDTVPHKSGMKDRDCDGTDGRPLWPVVTEGWGQVDYVRVLKGENFS